MQDERSDRLKCLGGRKLHAPAILLHSAAKLLILGATNLRDQEVGDSNPLAPTTFNSRSHIDLGRNCCLLFRFKNLSELVQQRLVFHLWEREGKTYLGRTLLPPSDIVE